MTALPARPVLPDWPARAIAILTTVDSDTAGGPHAIPVSALVRAGEHTILLSLHRSRGSLARLRIRPQVALLLLAEGNMIFTARGTAQVMAEPMLGAPDYAAVEINVTGLDDHRQGEVDETRALADRISTLQLLASMRLRCRATAPGAGGWL